MKIPAGKLQAVTEEINSAIADHHAKWGLENPPRLLVGVVEVAYEVLLDELAGEMLANHTLIVLPEPTEVERIDAPAVGKPLPENGKGVRGTARASLNNDELREAVATEMLRLTRLLGRAPTVPEWDRERDPSLPTAKGLFARFKIKWAELVKGAPRADAPPKSDEKLTSESEWQEAVEELVGVEALERFENGIDAEPVTLEITPSINGNSAPSSPATAPTATSQPEQATVTPLRIEPAPSKAKTVPLKPVSLPRTLAEVDAENGGKVAAVTAPKPADPSYVEQMAAKRKELRKRFLAVVAEMAVDGTMPTIAEFNERKPADMTRAGYLMNQLGYTSWDEVADDAGLKFAGRRVPAKAKKGGRR